MNADEARRKEIANAGQRLERFLVSLSPPDLARQSACEGWTVADVVAHIIERGRPIPDQIERGLAGDLSPTPIVPAHCPLRGRTGTMESRTPGPPPRAGRQSAAGVRPGQRICRREFDRVLSLVGPDDWDRLCYHRLRPETARAKADIRIAELAMHEWDIRWAFDQNATLATDSLPGLVSASGRAVRRAFRPDPARTRPVRYRFALSGPAAAEVDVILSPDGAAFRLNAPPEPADPPPDVTFRCAADTYAMIIFGRLKLAAALSSGAATAEGDAALVDDFIAAFVGG